MNRQTLEAVEFFRIAEDIAAYCRCEEAAERCKAKQPLTDRAAVTEAKNRGRAFLHAAQKNSAPPLLFRSPLFPVLKKLHAEKSSLTLEELYGTGLLCEQMKRLAAWAEQKPEQKTETASLSAWIQELPSLSDVHNAIFSFIDFKGAVRDIPSLRSLKQAIAAIEADIEKTMRSYCTDESTRAMLQTPHPVLRNGRQVIAVRSNFKGRIKGIIHEYSQTGQSFYLEPESIVIKNNELIKAEAEYERELRRLLQELTAVLAAEADVLEAAHNAALELDCIAAAARWAQEHRALFISDTENGKTGAENAEDGFFLYQARHPLLGSHAVPIDICLSPEERALIITGPNAGGKTVSLKTAALFVLLNQTGWPIPAAEKTRLPFFTRVFCAIGDAQSLEQSLSTFSAYMKTIAGILGHADDHTLVILDELASGTDPQEGGALAMAVLDTLLSRRSRIFVTTHHGMLKNYAYGKKDCVNASVAFDSQTLRPAYRIVMGVPGESHALTIAEQSGVPAGVITAAHAYLSNHTADVSVLIQSLTEKHARLDAFIQEKEAESKALEEKQRQCDLKLLQVRQKETELKTQGYKRLEDLFETKRHEIENLVRFIREGELTRGKTGGVKQFFAAFEAELAQERSALNDEQTELAVLQSANTENTAGSNSAAQDGVSGFKEGAEVFIPHLRRCGIIQRKERNGWQVAVDTLKMTLPPEKLQAVQPPPQKASASRSFGVSPAACFPAVTVQTYLQDNSRPVLELRLLGMRLAEAEAALQRQLDLAFMHNMQEFSVIHGKGNGILQKMVHETLKGLSGVAEFAFARPEHGGSGKTIVKLGLPSAQ